MPGQAWASDPPAGHQPAHVWASCLSSLGEAPLTSSSSSSRNRAATRERWTIETSSSSTTARTSPLRLRSVVRWRRVLSLATGTSGAPSAQPRTRSSISPACWSGRRRWRSHAWPGRSSAPPRAACLSTLARSPPRRNRRVTPRRRSRRSTVSKYTASRRHSSGPLAAAPLNAPRRSGTSKPCAKTPSFISRSIVRSPVTLNLGTGRPPNCPVTAHATSCRPARHPRFPGAGGASRLRGQLLDRGRNRPAVECDLLARPSIDPALGVLIETTAPSPRGLRRRRAAKRSERQAVPTTRSPPAACGRGGPDRARAAPRRRARPRHWPPARPARPRPDQVLGERPRPAGGEELQESAVVPQLVAGGLLREPVPQIVSVLRKSRTRDRALWTLSARLTLNTPSSRPPVGAPEIATLALHPRAFRALIEILSEQPATIWPRAAQSHAGCARAWGGRRRPQRRREAWLQPPGPRLPHPRTPTRSRQADGPGTGSPSHRGAAGRESPWPRTRPGENARSGPAGHRVGF